MSIRDNEERTGAPQADSPPIENLMPVDESPKNSNPLSFVTPTEFVELPSKGRYYPENHPLHNEETIEIRYMTAKEEDILTSRTLLKKGIAIDRLLESVILDKRIKADGLLIGDKNAIIVASRITGYGPEYKTNVICPACTEYVIHTFDLENMQINFGGPAEGTLETENGTFIIHLDKVDVDVEVKLLTGKDEKALAFSMNKKKKNKLEETSLTDQFRQFIVSVNDIKDPGLIGALIENMPATDSRKLRNTYQKVIPNIDLTQEFICDNCGLEQALEVPFTADFFWVK
ncbi:hypothetical protein CL634_10870 [bacterium]|nr:hypothetical protein [bacterium]|tara:strand:+ start:1866 stop:2729 length:864 start_codon:yes stop_codon:yes gene_type:complete